MSADVVFLYDQVIEHLVRLRWLASSAELAIPDLVSEDIDHVAELLAKRDLLVFAASLRNFGEATSSIPSMRKFSARLSQATPETVDFHREIEQTITLYGALSRILHAKYVTIVRLPELLLPFDEYAKTVADPSRKRKFLRRPLVRLSTKRDGETLVMIDSVISMSCQYLAMVLKALGPRAMLSRVDRDGAQ